MRGDERGPRCLPAGRGRWGTPGGAGCSRPSLPRARPFKYTDGGRAANRGTARNAGDPSVPAAVQIPD